MSTKTRTLVPSTGKTRPDLDRVEKPKQTKSRTGCVTCKAKRLKCDEGKPTCLKCKKRDVKCEGYKKDWKWRPCETEAFTIKSEGVPKPKRGNITFKIEEAHAHPATPSQESFESPSISSSATTPQDPSFKVWSPKATKKPRWKIQPQDDHQQSLHNARSQLNAALNMSPPLTLSPSQSQDESFAQHLGYQPQPSSSNAPTHQQEPYRPPNGASWPQPQYLPPSPYAHLPPVSHVRAPPTYPTRYNHSSPSLSRQSTNLLEIQQQYGQPQDGYRQYGSVNMSSLLHPNIPGPPASPSPSQASQSSNRSSSQTPTIDFMLNKDPVPPYRPMHYVPPLATEVSYADDASQVMQGIIEAPEPIEEIIRNPEDNALLLGGYPRNPSSSDSSSTPSEPELQIVGNRQALDSLNGAGREIWSQIFQWKYAPEHEDMLVRTFMDNTCGILSVKNGETENPWKTLIWPLAHESPALRHAIISMAAFHGSEDNRDLIAAGQIHSNRSFKGLRHDLQSGDATKVVTSLATSLALAFSESWNETGYSAGVTHLTAAKHLVKRAKEVTWQAPGLAPVKPQLMTALSFLLNTYVYIAVITRLISIDNENTDFDAISSPASSPFLSSEIDPLMGCAGTLYPIIGKVTKLVGQVRNSEQNTKAIIEDARYLKSLVERWEPPSSFEPVEDPTLEEQHSILTAEAYRATTLLYLHQAVPEIESEPAAELASRALSCLAAVPITSGAVIIQIFPLLAAGCEANSQAVRDWVDNRWDEMKRRMKIRNLDRCLEVTHEVWHRRDHPETNDAPDAVGGPGPQLFSVSLPHSDIYIPSQEATSFGYPLRVFDYAGGTPNFPGQVSPENQVGQRFDRRKTVKGWAHWVMVMRSWHWEVLLG